MQSFNTIEHDGVITDLVNGTVKVQVQRSTACSDCHAKGICGAGNDDQNMIVSVTEGKEAYQPGDHVRVVIRQGLALRAVFLSYVLPLVIVIVSLVIFSYFTTEGLAGVLALVMLVPYFLYLKFSNSKLEKQFAVTIRKIGDN
ncbi:MAG: SoxR reducing system RseC family protein [Bacteroidota bacterium]